MLTKITIQNPIAKQEDIFIPDSILVTDFTATSGSTFVDKFNKINNGPQSIIPIQVDSYGGQVYSLLGMLDLIRASEKIVGTYVQTKAMSCGAVLLSAGTKGYRFASPNATILIHEVGAGAGGKNTDIQADAEETARLNDLLLGILAKNSNKPKSFYVDMIHEANNADLYITAKEALKFGLIDKIGVPIFEMTVQATYKFYTR